MARRIVEEDVPSTTVVGSDGSWVGQTIVALVVIALLVVGAIYLFNNVGDNDSDGGGGDTKKVDVNVDTPGDSNEQPEPASS
ncbi:MAG TPA: hypothetical protein VNB94_00210 [Mycobacteriales bacterium]|nr:hypothetical protein [Mycobacteriales bacterium]